jgi:hypothetical protein
VKEREKVKTIFVLPGGDVGSREDAGGYKQYAPFGCNWSCCHIVTHVCNRAVSFTECVNSDP